MADAWIQGWQGFNTERDLWENLHGTLAGFLPDANPVMGKLRSFDDPQNRMEEDDAAKKEMAQEAQDEHDENQDDKNKEKGGHEDHTSALFWYGLRTRGAGPGAVPKGNVATLTPEETAELEVVKRKVIPPEWFKFGAVGYPQPLSQTSIQHYSLTDLANVLTQASSVEIVTRLKDYVKLLREEHPDTYFDEIFQDYFHPRGRYTDQVPIKDASGRYDIRLITVVMRANFKGQSPSAVMEGWWDEFAPKSAAQEQLIFNAQEPLQVVRQWMKAALLEDPKSTDGDLWSMYIANQYRRNSPEGYDVTAVLNALDATYGEPSTQQNFYRMMAEIRDNMQHFREGDVYTLDMVESYADDLPSGSRSLLYFLNPEASDTELDKQNAALLGVYQEIRAAFTYDFPYLNIPKDILGLVFYSYLDMEENEDDTYFEMSSAGRTPKGTAVPMPEKAQKKFQGPELLKGNYTREQFEHQLIALGGYIAEPEGEASDQLADLMKTLNEIFSFKSTDITEWQEKQDEIAALAQQLADLGGSAYESNKARVDEATNWVVEKIQGLSTGQRDINTGKKAGGGKPQKFTAADLNDWFTSLRNMAGEGKRTLSQLDSLENDARDYDEDDIILGILNAAVPVGFKNYGYAPDNYESVAECIIEVAGINLSNWANSKGKSAADTSVIPFPISPFDMEDMSYDAAMIYVHKIDLIKASLQLVLLRWQQGKLTKSGLEALMNNEKAYSYRWDQFDEEELKSRDSFLAVPEATRRADIEAALQNRVNMVDGVLSWLRPLYDKLRSQAFEAAKARQAEEQAQLDAQIETWRNRLNEILASRTTDPEEYAAFLSDFNDMFDAMPGTAQNELDDLMKQVDEHLTMLKANLVDPGAEAAAAVPDADPAVSTAIQSARDLLNMQSSDMSELRAARQQLRGIYQTLQDAGQLEANTDLLDGAARHLADLLIAIQKAGGPNA